MTILEATRKSQSKRMLSVEDSQIAQRMITIFVESLGFECDVANTGQEAVDLFEPGKYAAIFLDIGLPDFDGYEVARRFRETEKGSGYSVPIIGISAHAPEDIDLNLAADINIMFTKPLRSEKAKVVLREYGVIE